MWDESDLVRRRSLLSRECWNCVEFYQNVVIVVEKLPVRVLVLVSYVLMVLVRYLLQVHLTLKWSSCKVRGNGSYERVMVSAGVLRDVLEECRLRDTAG